MTETTEDPSIIEWAEDLPGIRHGGSGRNIITNPPKMILELMANPNKWGVVEKRALPAQPNGKWARYRHLFGMGVATRKLNGYLYVYGRMTEEAIAAFKEKVAEL
jgi:hypothetical protein